MNAETEWNFGLSSAFVNEMKHERAGNNNQETGETSTNSEKAYYAAGPSVHGEGTSADLMDKEDDMRPLECLEFELQQSSLNVQEIGRIIADGILEKEISNVDLQELAKKWGKSMQSLANINVGSLSENLSRGTIDSRLVVVGNAFLWNVLKESMSTVRDKFDHYQFKMSTMTHSLIAPMVVDFSTTRVRIGQHIVPRDDIFRQLDLLDVYCSVVFRKTGDINNKSKQFIKAYMVVATQPRCAIWHYSLRQSGSSHKKWLQNIPEHIVSCLLSFLLALAGLDVPELDGTNDQLDEGGRFFLSLGEIDEMRASTYNAMKSAREQLLSKFRACVAGALNETREMPYNTNTKELMAPPRGKPMDSHHCVTWRQYESLIKRCELDPSKENLEAKHVLDTKLQISYEPSLEEEEMLRNVKEEVE
uniref:Pkinase_fungal domain-containing protein n=2 Tax=Caenorhabditis tropicalis TaxID=1561998 RepID=A0A1I7TLD4_9PELO